MAYRVIYATEIKLTWEKMRPMRFCEGRHGNNTKDGSMTKLLLLKEGRIAKLVLRIMWEEAIHPETGANRQVD